MSWPSFEVNAGLPVALTLDALGAPVNALDAASADASQFVAQLQTGNLTGAIGTLIDAPAVVTNALPIDAAREFRYIGLPLYSEHSFRWNPGSSNRVYRIGKSRSAFGTITVPVTGTPLSGIVPALLIYENSRWQ